MNPNEVPGREQRARLVELLVRAALPRLHRRAGSGFADDSLAFTWACGEHIVAPR